MIDAALKYGYDNSESFSRAFVKFHGITLSEAKSTRAELKSFSRLSVKLILEGGTVMDYRIEKREAFQELMKKIYTEVFPTNRYQPSGGMCIEVYLGNNAKSDFLQQYKEENREKSPFRQIAWKRGFCADRIKTHILYCLVGDSCLLGQ